MKSNLERIGNTRGVLDLVSPVQQTLVVKSPGSLKVRLKAEVRGRNLGLLHKEEDSLVHQWVVLWVQLHGD